MVSTDSPAQESNQYIHDKYAGKIVFAENRINFENIDDGLLKDHFRLLNTIYGKAFFEMPMAAYYETFNWSYDFKDADLDYNFSTVIFIDGEMAIKLFDELAQEPFNNYTYLDLVIAPGNIDKYKFSLLSTDWVNKVTKLSEGEHSVMLTSRKERSIYPARPVVLRKNRWLPFLPGLRG
jgi:hypothetical protein